jgi:hypothetical protein
MALQIRPQFRVSVPGKLPAKRGFLPRREVAVQGEADAMRQQSSTGKDLVSSLVNMPTHHPTRNPTVPEPEEGGERK